MTAEAPPWTTDERAAVRAYLQRSEVRLSTIHRVATALLSGAGLMVLLPAIARESIADVLRALLQADQSPASLLLAAATVVVVALPIVALCLLLRDLTSFYFHGHHLATSDGHVFVPRFTLTGLRLPLDELGPSASAQLEAARNDPGTIELLVPPKDSTRRLIDAQLDAYGGLGRHDFAGDAGRAAGLFALVASRERTLAEETAKLEHGMARHILRLQVIVLRYVKALLLFLTTAVAVFSSSGVIQADPSLQPPAQVWLAAVILAWACGVVVAVADPVRTIEAHLRSEGATRAALGADHQLTYIERVAVRTASIGWLLAMGALGALIVDASATDRTRTIGGIVAAAGAVVFGALIVRWRQRMHT